MCNEWLDKADKKVFERMKQNNPRRYQVAGLGNWGIVDGLVYENWKEEKFDLDIIRNLDSAFGLDFGYTNDPTALFCGAIDLKNKKIYVYDELYQKGMSNKAIYEKINQMGYSKEKITAGCTGNFIRQQILLIMNRISDMSRMCVQRIFYWKIFWKR